MLQILCMCKHSIKLILGNLWVLLLLRRAIAKRDSKKKNTYLSYSFLPCNPGHIPPDTLPDRHICCRSWLLCRFQNTSTGNLNWTGRLYIPTYTYHFCNIVCRCNYHCMVFHKSRHRMFGWHIQNIYQNHDRIHLRNTHFCMMYCKTVPKNHYYKRNILLMVGYMLGLGNQCCKRIGSYFRTGCYSCTWCSCL